MIVNSVIQSANLRGGARLSDIFQHQVFMVGGEFRVDAAVVHEAVANVPRDDWNAKRTNSIGSRRSSPLQGRCRFHRQHSQPCAAVRGDAPQTNGSFTAN